MSPVRAAPGTISLGMQCDNGMTFPGGLLRSPRPDTRLAALNHRVPDVTGERAADSSLTRKRRQQAQADRNRGRTRLPQGFFSKAAWSGKGPASRCRPALLTRRFRFVIPYAVQWKMAGEPTAFAGCTGDLQLSAVVLQHILDNGESEPGSAAVALP